MRACVHVEGGALRIARRPHLPLAPRGDLLQAGPLLVEQGRPVVRDGVDPEGFSAGSAQFDSDITDGRHPRAALGVADGIALSVTCDGRSPADAGLTLGELAELMAALGAQQAINLDGGGSATQVCGARMVNRPRELDGRDIQGGRPIYTALDLHARALAPAAPASAPIRWPSPSASASTTSGRLGRVIFRLPPLIPARRRSRVSPVPAGPRAGCPHQKGGKMAVSSEDTIGFASEESEGPGGPRSADAARERATPAAPMRSSFS